MKRILAVILSITLAFGGIVLPDGVKIFDLGRISAHAENQTNAELWEYEAFEYTQFW